MPESSLQQRAILIVQMGVAVLRTDGVDSNFETFDKKTFLTRPNKRFYRPFISEVNRWGLISFIKFCRQVTNYFNKNFENCGEGTRKSVKKIATNQSIECVERTI